MHASLQRKKAGGSGGKRGETPPVRAQRAPAAGAADGGARSEGGAPGVRAGTGPAVKLGGPVQAKLTVGRSGDRFEREADHVAERVASGGTAGEVSRIPAGGLAAQRQGEEAEDQAQAQRQEEETSEETPAQARCAACEAEEKEGAQRQEEGGAGEEAAQAKCAACEAKEKAQRQEEGGEEPVAQAKCAACEAKEKAQRQEEEGGEEPAQPAAAETDEVPAQRQEEDEAGAAETAEAEEESAAQTRGGDDEPVQRQPEGAGGAGDVEEEGEESTGAAAPGVEGAEDADVRECGAGEVGEEADEDEEAAGAEGREAGARDDLGCGDEGGGGDGGEAAPGGGGQSCGAAVESAGEEGEAASGGSPGAEEGAEAEAPPPAAPGPACGEGVEAAEERPGEEAAEGAAPTPAGAAPGGAPPDGACATAQRQAEDGDASRPEGAPAQSQDGGEEEGAAQRQNEGDEESAQAQDDENERETPVAQGAEEGEAAQAKAEDTGKPVAQARGAGAARRGHLDTGTAARLIHARGAGEPLAPAVRGRLEAGMGVDLQDVRVHADGNAHAASRALRAKAFAHGNHIFLASGQSQHDVGLMAHETTHVLQQGGVVRRKPAADSEPRRREVPAGGGAASEPAAAEPGVTTAPPVATPGTAPATAPAPATPGPAGETRPAPGPGAEPVAPTAEPARETGPATATTATPAVPGAPAAPVPTGPPGGPAGLTPEEPAAAAAGAAEAPGAEPAAPAERGERRGGRAGAPPGAGVAAGPGEPTLGAPAASGAGPAVPHPGAAAAAAARLADDRRRMAGVKRRLGREAVRQKGPAATRPKQVKASSGAASAASEAAPTPANEPLSRGEAVYTGRLEATEAERGKVRPPTFLELVDRKLAAMKTPKTLGEMDDFKDQGGARELKEEVAGGVGAEVGKADGKLRGTLAAGPKPEPERVPTPLGPIPKPPSSARLGAAEAAPAPRAEEEVSLEPSREQVEADLAEHRLTKERLEKANDPRFTALQKSRETVHEHADRAPAELRRKEAATLAAGRRDLRGGEAAAGAEMRGAHGVAQGSTRLHQGVAMVQESLERHRVAAEIESRYKAVESKVRGKLDWLAGKDGEEGEVDRLFNEGEKDARQAFEEHVDREIKAWKRRRYGGRAAIPLIGGLVAGGTWVYDKLKGIDSKVQKYFDAGRTLYLDGLRRTIETIAGTVETALGWCNERIAEGRKDIQDYIDTKLPRHLRTVGKRSAAAVFERFDELREEVDATREELADRLVERYRESQQAIDDRIQEMQAENRGLVERFVEKLKEIVEAIRNFRRKIGPILAEAGDVVEDIIDDPIGFLGNLLEAIGRGFSQFKARIDEHLKKGVIAWLFGTLASGGVQVPKELSLRSMGGLVLDVLGLSFDKVKARAARIVGPRAMGVIEKVAGYLGTLYRDGPGGLWAEIENDVGDLKEKILDEVKSWVITRIVTAAVKKLAMMFNPVGAIIQAVLTIYNVIMFFLENIDRILELVRTVVRSAADVVRGKIQAAADKIETALGMIVPLILAFLARLLNLGGIAEKVRSVIKRFQTKIDKAVTRFLRKLVAKFKRRFTAKGKQRAPRERAPTADPKLREARKREAVQEVRAALAKGIGRARLQALLARLRRRLQLKRAALTTGNDVEIENSAKETVKGEAVEVTLAATVGTTRTAKGKLKRKKTARGGLLLGKFKARAPVVATVRGVLEEHVTTWPYPDMPTRAPRPSSVRAELYGKASHLARVSTAPGARFVGELGNVEALVRRKTADYDSGHLVANEFGGGEGFDNLTPMRATFNREGPYRKLEGFVDSKLPPAAKAADPEVAVTMKVTPTYAARVSTTVGQAAERVRARLKGLAEAKKAVESKGEPWRHATGAEVDARVVSGSGRAAKPVRIPARIAKAFKVAVSFKAELDAADELPAADREKLDKIAEAPRGRVAAPREGPLLVLEELAPKAKGAPGKGGAAPAGKGPRTVKAQKVFDLPHVDL